MIYFTFDCTNTGLFLKDNLNKQTKPLTTVGGFELQIQIVSNSVFSNLSAIMSENTT